MNVLVEFFCEVTGRGMIYDSAKVSYETMKETVSFFFTATIGRLDAPIFFFLELINSAGLCKS